MGIRSTFISEDVSLIFPAWFVERWEGCVHFGEMADGARSAPISSKFEAKLYGESGFTDLEEDVRKALVERQPHVVKSLRIVWLHETGHVTIADVGLDGVKYREAYKWESVDEPELDYVPL